MLGELDGTVDRWCDTGEHEVLICRCEEVAKAEIVEAIKEGAQTIDEIKRRTRAGMGLCQGKTCRRLIQKILAQLTDQEIEEIMPSRHRPPTRPISLKFLTSPEEE